MKKIYFTAECKISEKLYKKLIKEPKLVWNTDDAIGMIAGYPILITGATLERKQ
jgi:hypothetical protein